MLKYLLVLFCMLTWAGNAFAQEAMVSGTLKLDTAIWTSKIYISSIPDFNLMYTSSHNLIIAEKAIDTTGQFTIEFPVSKQETLFRLHLVRKNDPVSTLIIGGNEENNVFFIAKDADKLNIQSNDTTRIIQQKDIKGSKANGELNTLFALLNNDTLNRELAKDSLITIAANSGSALVSLLAIQKTFGLNSEHKKRISNILDDLDKENPYGTRLFKEYNTSVNWAVYVLPALLLLVVVIVIVQQQVKKRSVLKIRLSLSQRETHIVQLILANKTNKEIAEELNIELSTVKTHINNIFSKLNLSNRKELVKYKQVFSN